MTKQVRIVIGIVLIVLAIVFCYKALYSPEFNVGVAVDCQSNTCFTSLGVTGAFQVDGATIHNGTVTNNSTVTNTAGSSFTSTVTIGSSGTAITQLQKGTCALLGTDVSLAASSTAPYDCAVTGVVSGDLVIAQLSSSTPATAGNSAFVITASKASTTAGFITVLMRNVSNTAAVPSVAGYGSTTQYIIIR